MCRTGKAGASGLDLCTSVRSLQVQAGVILHKAPVLLVLLAVVLLVQVARKK